MSVQENGEEIKVARVACLTAKAEEVFGNEEKAKRWLSKPKNALDGALLIK